MNLPSELSFLNNYYLDPQKHYRTANWLISNFEEKIWTYNFGSTKNRYLDWDIRLDNGTSLASECNLALCNSFKYFTIAATRRAAGSSDDTNALQTQKKGFNLALLILDILLLNPQYQISRYGLGGLSINHLKDILAKFCQSTDTSESVYNWSQTLKLYCLDTLNRTNKDDIESFLQQHPHANIVTSDQINDDILGLEPINIPRIRAALHLNGDYSQPADHAQCTINSLVISQKIFINTIKGARYPKTRHEILSFYKDSYADRTEYPAVKITTGENEKISQSYFNALKMTIYRLGILHELGLDAPSIDTLKHMLNAPYPSTVQPGRFRTLPSEVVFSTARKAIELHLHHGKEIVNGFCRVAIRCCRYKVSPSKFTSKEIRKIIGPHLSDLGVKYLGLSARSTGSAAYCASVRPEKNEYFVKLRNNAGLLELISVYIGSVQLVVGMLMARRIDELAQLSSASCLDSTETLLIFGNGKSTSGLFGVRRREARPIDPLAVEMIKNLIRMHKILKRIGYIDTIPSLFATPSRHGSTNIAPCNTDNFNKNLDLVCDYFQTEVTPEGCRYYIRQHQLRRFFALVFFYSSSFGGLETLQWVLGHTNLSHVWNYITESLDGATLRGAKAQYVAEKLHSNGAAEFTSLARILKERYNIENFTIIDTEELEHYIEALLVDSIISIEPEFFENEHGERFEIVIKLTQEEHRHA
ncbi:TPA: integrase [Pseudomonas aeruginosa]|jgi:hypothetical protein|uniref:integrase n=1 Tax=Pseudomonadaceae TaxID=135621 RepID=UPI00114F958C|nr:MULTISPECIES: integrase [Pseudomonas aeruginosa group]MEE1950788.1 integrase [Pseudomonas alcaligenes]TQI06914.1 integrase [Pseudomonas aeruginosa]HCE7213220.1 integrase [Pseudomonas aeruginosa]HCE7551245.1 integrase [Pseudomonas aeruginosa]HCE7578272.1 integrase [Pseudomonas aeruginosa]